MSPQALAVWTGVYEPRRVAEAKIIAEISPEELKRRQDDLLLPIGPETAAFLMAEICARGPEVVTVEIGGCRGYSTICLAAAVAHIGGPPVISIEMDAEKQAYARERIAEAGLSAYVDFQLGKAEEIIPKLADMKLGVVLLDHWKDVYIQDFDLLFPLLGRESLVAADNMLRPVGAVPDSQKFQSHVRGMKSLVSVTLRMCSGVELIVLR